MLIFCDIMQIDQPRHQKLEMPHAVAVLLEVEAISFNLLHIVNVKNADAAWKVTYQKRQEQLAAKRKCDFLIQSKWSYAGENNA